jgi:hypothetical protein
LYRHSASLDHRPIRKSTTRIYRQFDMTGLAGSADSHYHVPSQSLMLAVPLSENGEVLGHAARFNQSV